MRPLALFRIIFAVYFSTMNATMLFNFEPLFGSKAVPKTFFGDYYTSPTLRTVFGLDDGWFAAALIANIVLVLYFAFGAKKRVAIFGCWLLMTFIFIRIPISRSIHIPFLGYLMLLNIFIPDASADKEDGRLGRDFCPTDVRLAAWAVIAGNYLMAALYKLGTPEWRTGTALSLIFQDIMPRPNILTAFLNRNSILLMLATYAVLVIEGLGWCLMFNSRSRYWFVSLSALLHLAILILFRMEALSLGMLVFHSFLLASNVEEKRSSYAKATDFLIADK